jgi:uncharacterized protein
MQDMDQRPIGDDEAALNVATVEAAYRAFGRRDLPALLDVLDPEIDWVVPAGAGPVAGSHRGHEDVLEHMFLLLPEDTGRLSAEPDEFLPAGDRVIVLGHHRGRSAVDGQPFVIPFVHVWTLREGYAVRYQPYFDTAAFRAAIFGGA